MSTTLSTTNAQVNPPDATTLADDLVAGVHFPIVKLDVGAAGASSMVTAANPLPTTAAISGTVTVTGTVATNPPANASTNIAQYGGATTSLGSKTSINSMPVVIASDQAAVAISGTVTTSPPANASTNIVQFGGNAVQQTTGASGAGVPRVTVSNDSQLQIWDGTNTATVKAASTAASATDKALVVAVSPNNTVPVSIAGTVTTSGTVTANQGGTWTVQPGNTANTTAWKVDGSAVTQPVSGTVTANQGGAPWSDNLTQVGGAAVSLGAKVSASSIPVVLATDEATLPVSIAGTVTVQGGSTPATLLTVYNKELAQLVPLLTTQTILLRAILLTLQSSSADRFSEIDVAEMSAGDPQYIS